MNKAKFTQRYLESGSFVEALESVLTEDDDFDLDSMDLYVVDKLFEWAREIDRADEKKPRSFTDIAWEMYDWLVNYVEENHPDSDPSVKLHMNNLLHFFAISFLYQIVEGD